MHHQPNAHPVVTFLSRWPYRGETPDHFPMLTWRAGQVSHQSPWGGLLRGREYGNFRRMSVSRSYLAMAPHNVAA